MLKAVNSIHNLGGNGCGITISMFIHKMWLAKIQMLFFCKIILLGSKVVAMALCLQGDLIGVDLASENMIQAL